MRSDRILIAGDFFVRDSHKSSGLFSGQIQKYFAESTLGILNLEAPVTRAGDEHRIVKTGPHLKAAPGTVMPLLDKLNIDLVTLANNHILDYGEVGLNDTFENCDKARIDFTGAGMTADEAGRPSFFELDNSRCAVLNFAENEWANTQTEQPGANPLDIIDNVKQIRQVSEQVDHLVVIIHGGNEYTHYPSPRMVKQYRYYAENGASAIVGHHTHYVSGYEVHKGVPICYSLGNFLFTKGKKDKGWYEGLVLALDISPEGELGFKLLPVRQHRESHYVDFVEGKKKQQFLEKVEEISRVIRDEKELREKWDAFLSNNKNQYLKALSPVLGIQNRYLRGILIRTGLYKLLYRDAHLKELLNRIRCEAHRDAVIEILKKELEI